MSDEISKIPVGMSAGGDNSHYVNCDVLGQKKAYAACLHIRVLFDEVQHADKHPYFECFNAIRRGVCPALAMRRQELEAEEALFYKPRPKSPVSVVKFNKQDSSYARGWNSVGAKLDHPKLDDLPTLRGVSKPAPIQRSKVTGETKKPEKPAIMEMDYSAVVNEMMADSKEEPKSEPKRSVTGNSLLDIARKMNGG